MIGHLPLWVVVATWWMQRRHTPRMTVTTIYRMQDLIEDVFSGMPLARTNLERLVTRQVMNWVENERKALALMRQLGVVYVGTIQNEKEQ